MCRLFAFKSVLQSQIHQSLVNADNAIAQQSLRHPDGWGVAYYVENSPHIIKSENKAIEDKIFQKVSGVVTSNTVLAHIRKATLGSKSILNTHPFQYGPWVFAHNGNIKNFKELKNDLLQLVSPNYRQFILGETDSEILFFIILSEINKNSQFTLSLEKSISKVLAITGDYEKNSHADNSNTFLSFILTNGKELFAFNGGKDLHYSTYKSRCPESNTCPYFNKTCENKASPNSPVNHLLISSEPLQGQNIWDKTLPGQLIVCQPNLVFNIIQMF